MVLNRLWLVCRQDLRGSILRDSILWDRVGKMNLLWLGLLSGPGDGTWRGKVRCISTFSISFKWVNKLSVVC